MPKNKPQETKEHYATLYDIPRETISEIQQQIKLSWKYRQHRGAFIIVGEAGVGKSQIIGQLAKDEGARIYDVRTAHYGLVGAGIPSTKNAPEGFFDIVVPSVFPKPGEKSIMLFEEINQGLQHAISMFFSLVEDRRMFNYTLPNDALVVALMNPATAMYAVTQIENNAALRRRLKWLFAIESFQGWYHHAQTKRFHETDTECLGKALPCHPQILDFLKIFPNNLYDKKAQRESRQYMCPATAQTVSLDAYVLEKEGLSLTNTFATSRFAASIGEHMATQLVSFISDNTTAIKVSDVLENYSKTQSAVKRLLEKSEHEKLTELNMNLLTYLFSIQPNIKKAAGNLIDYLADIPNEMRISLLTQLKKTAEENKAEPYLFKLMEAIQAHGDKWTKIHTELDTAQTNIMEILSDCS